MQPAFRCQMRHERRLTTRCIDRVAATKSAVDLSGVYLLGKAPPGASSVMGDWRLVAGRAGDDAYKRL